MKELNSNANFLIAGIVVAVIIIIIGFSQSQNKLDVNDVNNATSTAVSGKYDDFAKCLASKNVTMYGAAWCSHCAEQKKEFGSSFQYVKYVECPDNIKLCEEKKVLGYPTWIDGSNKLYEGVQSFENLAKISGCDLPK